MSEMDTTRSKGSGQDQEHVDQVVLECCACKSRLNITRPMGVVTIGWVDSALIVRQCEHPLSQFRVKIPRNHR